jgi:hypothetical protein
MAAFGGGAATAAAAAAAAAPFTCLLNTDQPFGSSK